MLSKIALALFCVCLLQGSFADSEQETNGVTNFAEAVLSRSRRSCGAGECNAHCKKLGHARGVCIGTYCQCRSRRRRSADEEQIAGKVKQLTVIAEDNNLPVASLDENIESDAAAIPSDVTKSRSARGTCGYDECNRFCRKLGHARGVCIGNYCQCRFRRRRSVDAPQDANHA